MTPSPPALPERLPRLDGVRAVAILMVLVHQFDRLAIPPGFVGKAFEMTIDRGWVGVQLFFVLSGFLITGILQDTRAQPHAYRDFLIRRTLRIFPLYFGTLALLTLVLPALGLVPAAFREHAIWYWLFVSNWTHVPIGGSLPHFWSLAVEEQFYLLWPLAALRLRAKGLARVCVGVMLASLAARIALRVAAMPPEAIYMATIARMDALAVGALVALWMRWPGGVAATVKWSGALCLGAVGLFVAGLAATQYEWNTALGQVLGYEVLSIVFGIGIALSVAADAGGGGRWTAWLRARPLQRIGLYSFAMYVFHKPLHDLVGKPLLTSLGYPEELPVMVGVAYIILAIGATFVLAAASYHLYERPFLALRARWTRARPGNLPG